MQFDKLQEAYLDYVNNYLTVSVYADHNGLTVKQAETLIHLGRECHESYCRMLKESGLCTFGPPHTTKPPAREIEGYSHWARKES